MTRKKRSGSDRSTPRTGTTTPLEWLVAVVGLALVVGTIAVLLHHTRENGDHPPEIVAEASSVSRAGAAYLVEVRVENRGGRPAGSLKIEGTHRGAGDEEEVSDVVVDYLAPHSTGQVTLMFSRDPRRGSLAVRAVSFREP